MGSLTAMPDDFALRAQLRDTALEVALAGELDMSAAFKLEPELDRLLAEPDVSALVLDLGEVGFVDSAGLGALLSIRQRADDLGIGVAISSASDPVRRLLEITGEPLG
jgi:anti-anti-sigma factor